MKGRWLIAAALLLVLAATYCATSSGGVMGRFAIDPPKP